MERHMWEERGYTSSGYLVQNVCTGEKREFATHKEALEFLFDESVELARSVGVEEDKILHNKEEIDKFFGSSGE